MRYVGRVKRKMPSNMRKMCGFRWCCAYAKYHPGLSSPFIQYLVSNDSFSGQQRPWKDITRTYLYNFDPLKPHFYVVKLELTGVYIIFLISAQKHRLWYSLEPPRRGGSNEYPQSMFWAEILKNITIFIWKFSFFGGKKFQHIWIGMFS